MKVYVTITYIIYDKGQPIYVPSDGKFPQFMTGIGWHLIVNFLSDPRAVHVCWYLLDVLLMVTS